MSLSITIDSPLDMHIHFREGEMARTVVPLSTQHFSGGIVMPNLVPPVDCMERLLHYRAEIDGLTDNTSFKPLYTLFLRPYEATELHQLAPLITACKLYPAGVTTNSEGGARDIDALLPTISLLESLDIPLLIHGETHGFVMDREAEFLPVYERLASLFPRLRIVMEHITTKAAVDLLDRFDNLYATITAHHLVTTLDDVIGGLLNPHLFCKPIPKHPRDRDALCSVAISAHPKVSFGSDSAPHPQHKKECCGCAAGVFTAPLALPLLADLFSRHDALEHLQAFVSDNPRRIYRIEVPRKIVTLVNEPWTVPTLYGSVIPMYAGQLLPWRVADVLEPRSYSTQASITVD